jgi:ABC-type multidrug transport system fused ATPase/permease subunit
MPLGGLRVLAGDASIGMFLATLKIIGKVGNEWAAIYKLFLQRQTAVPSLVNLIRLLNLPTDDSSLKTLTTKLTKETLQGMAAVPATARDRHHHALDLLPIHVENIGHIFAIQPRTPVHIDVKGKLEVQQGKLVCLAGPPGQGKATVLKLLSMQLSPDVSAPGAKFFVPSHLRVHYIPSQPLFFAGTLLWNLTFSVEEPGHPDAKLERVQGICRLLRLPEEVIDHVQEDHSQWMKLLSEVEARILCLARALITNPEVLCMDKPLVAFEPPLQEQILKVLKEKHVKQRGALQNFGTIDHRRPRTCIFSHIAEPDSEHVDETFILTREAGLKRSHKGSADDYFRI